MKDNFAISVSQNAPHWGAPSLKTHHNSAFVLGSKRHVTADFRRQAIRRGPPGHVNPWSEVPRYPTDKPTELA